VVDPRSPKYERPTLPWERKADPIVGWGQWATAGFEFGLCVVLFFLGGRWLDGRLSTAPWLTLAGTLVGVAAGMYLLIRTAVRGQLPAPPVPPPPAPGPRSEERTTDHGGPPAAGGEPPGAAP
jgi:hypothetical protein